MLPVREGDGVHLKGIENAGQPVWAVGISPHRLAGNDPQAIDAVSNSHLRPQFSVRSNDR